MPLLPSATQAIRRLRREAAGRPLALFLDFDGTLVGFRPRPEQVHLTPWSRALIAALARRHFVAVVSGRDLPDIRRRIALPCIWYAGSHGLDIAGPRRSFQPAAALRPHIITATHALEPLEGIEGVQLERKRFVVAVHYRRVNDRSRIPEIEWRVLRVMREVGGLTLLRNDQVLELRPGIEWHKGRAIEWLLDQAGGPGRYPIAIGDDITDEDAFRALRGSGAGILVRRCARPTAARYRLTNPHAVQGFLRQLL